MRNRNFGQGNSGQQHRYLYQPGAPPLYDGSTYDNIRVPSYWELTYIEGMPGFGAAENVTGRPESDIIYLPTAPDPARFNDGDYAFKAFTFWRNQALWLHQSFAVNPGDSYHWELFAHSWYSRCSNKPHSPDPLGKDCERILSWASMPLSIGIDPTGGKSPWASTVIWSEDYFIYGRYDYALTSPYVTATGSYMTVFLQSSTSHPLKHNDLYLANAKLTVTTPESDECKAFARVPYDQTIHVFNPAEGYEEYINVCTAAWDDGPNQVSPSSDAPFVGCGLGQKTGVWHHVLADDWSDYQSFADQHYPDVDITMVRKPWKDTVTPPSIPDFEPLSLHLQTEMIGWETYFQRLHDHGRPCRWAKFVFGAEASNKVGQWLLNGGIYRHVTNYGKLIGGDPAVAANAFLDEFWDAVVHNQYIRAVEGTNELMGTSNTPDEINAVIALEIAISNEVARRSQMLEDVQGRDVIAVLGQVPIGNLQHGAQTAMLAPLVDVAILNDHGIAYHPYYPATRDQQVTRHWLLTEGYHHHLRWQTSWLESIPQLAEARLFGTEGGAIRCAIRDDGRPGMYFATDGWRHPECLNGNVDFYVETLLLYRDLMLAAPLGPNIETYNIFTTGDPGVVHWDHFTFDEPVFSALVTALERIE